MSRLFYHVMQDNVGNLLFDVSGTMRLAGTGTLATIYGDEALTAILPNPMTNHPSFGSFKCYLPPGDYDFYMAKSGYTFETLTGVQGHGTLAQQDAGTVVITGGTATNLDLVSADRYVALNSTGDGVTGFTGQVQSAGGTGRFNLYITGSAPNHLVSPLLLGSTTVGNERMRVAFVKATDHGITMQQIGGDTGVGNSINFYSAAATLVGAISSNASSTTYSTSSDARLKEDVTPLTHALDVVRALNPVQFRWKRDGSQGHGLLAQEVVDVVDGVATGERGALDEQGNVLPMQIDYSKLVPYLIGAVKELTQQVEALTAKLAGA